MRILISEKLSEHRYKTPEGYLICTEAIIARTGKQTYRRDELFLDGDDTLIEVDRLPEEVFSEKTIASFENKPIVNEHPDENVNIDNYKDYSIGFMRDVKKANVDGQDVLTATLIFTDPIAIQEIEAGKCELSCGYDCDIEDVDNPVQRNIRGNHVALCECGRAGIARIIDSINDRPDRFLSVEAKELKRLLDLYKSSSKTASNTGSSRPRTGKPWNANVTEAMNDALQLIVEGKNLTIATSKLKYFYNLYTNMYDDLDKEDQIRMSKILSRIRVILKKLETIPTKNSYTLVDVGTFFEIYDSNGLFICSGKTKLEVFNNLCKCKDVAMIEQSLEELIDIAVKEGADRLKLQNKSKVELIAIIDKLRKENAIK